MPTTDLAALLHAAGLAPQESQEVAGHQNGYVLGYLAVVYVSLRSAAVWLWTVEGRERHRLVLRVLGEVIDIVARDGAAQREPREGVGRD